MESYYDLLGVSEDAPTEQIQRAYRERLKETHPDVSDREDAGERTRRLIEAKEVLVDDDERARYDRLGHSRYVAASDRADAENTTGEASGSAGHPTDRTRDAGGETATAGGDGTRTGNERSSGATEAGVGFGTTQSGDSGRAPRDSWRDGNRGTGGKHATGGTAGTEPGWRAWDTRGAYTVTNDSAVGTGGYTTSGSLVTLCLTFITYPLLLVAALFPGFPLFVNATIGLCLLFVVAYLQSIPLVGIVVFGSWSLLVPVVFASLGVSLFSPYGIAALLGTVVPLGLSLLTRTVVRG